jgi:hypothetical protein
MGLDTVELVMRIEDTFGIAIPDEEASRLLTPDDVTDYILTRVEVTDEPLPCLSQRTFYILRRSFIRTLQTPRHAFRPDVPLIDLLPADLPDEAWERVGRDTGLKEWPSILKPRWLRSFISHECQSCGDLVDYVLTHDVLSVKGAERRWTRSQVRDVLWRVIKNDTGVKDFTGTSHFVYDMGLD